MSLVTEMNELIQNHPVIDELKTRIVALESAQQPAEESPAERAWHELLSSDKWSGLSSKGACEHMFRKGVKYLDEVLTPELRDHTSYGGCYIRRKIRETSKRGQQ